MPTFHIMSKPVGPICNLDCKYCYYLEKENLYPERTSWRMLPDVLESFVAQYIAAQDAPEVTFAWQGGEPTLLGVEYFENVVVLQKKHAGGRIIHNALQTNGTLLDDAWCAFLKEHGFLVGVSIDGPQELHDTYRVDKQGRPTFDDVMRGITLLKKHGVDFNTLTVVGSHNGNSPTEVYDFLKEIGSGYIQFIPLVERRPGPATAGLIQLSLAMPPKGQAADLPVTEWSVRPEQYGAFLTTVFDEWVRKDVGTVFVQIFDVALGIWHGLGASLCVFRETCGDALAMEHNGDIYSCDHYVYPEYKLGNVSDGTLGTMVTSDAQRKFGRDKAATLPAYCRSCDVRFACNGECPKHRFATTPDGEWGLNYLCAGYKQFFTHIGPAMRTMSALIRQGRAPTEIMRLPRRGTIHPLLRI
jgi:uncharacterized protein